MLRFLTKERKGFTIVEVMIVLVLLSFGVLALANIFKVTYRAFQKSEERSIKQETVKFVAEVLRTGSSNVASATSADIFNDTSIIPKKDADQTYSYLYTDPHYICTECGEDWSKITKCSNSSCESKTGKVDGYFLRCLNRGIKRSCDFENTYCSTDHCECPDTTTGLHICRECTQCKCKAKSIKVSGEPVYVEFNAMKQPNPGETEDSNQCGVVIRIAALENDFVYEELNAEGQVVTDENGDAILARPISDDIYYNLDVAYSFPNMLLSGSNQVVNFSGRERNATNKYNDSGNRIEGSQGVVESVDEGGCVLRVYSDAIISADDAYGKLSQPKMCFIATASYGHDSGEVGLLCNFRDKCLLTNPLGTAFVKAYYQLSPPIAEFIADSEPLKAVVRLGLKPLVAVATNALDSEVASQNALWFVVFMLCGAGATATLIRIDKKKKKLMTK